MNCGANVLQMNNLLKDNVEKTNLYAKQDKSHQGFEIYKAEMLRFPNILYVSSYYASLSESHYWSTWHDLDEPFEIYE